MIIIRSITCLFILLSHLLGADPLQQKVGKLNIQYDENGKIESVLVTSWEAEKVDNELRELYKKTPFKKLVIYTVDLTPEIINAILTFKELEYLEIGSPPEGVHMKNKKQIEELIQLQKLKEVTLCINGLTLRDVLFMSEMKSIWKIAIIKAD